MKCFWLFFPGWCFRYFLWTCRKCTLLPFALAVFYLICLESCYKSTLCFNVFFCQDRQGQYKKNKRIGVLIFVYQIHSFSFPLMPNFLECWTITFWLKKFLGCEKLFIKPTLKSKGPLTYPALSYKTAVCSSGFCLSLYSKECIHGCNHQFNQINCSKNCKWFGVPM